LFEKQENVAITTQINTFMYELSAVKLCGILTFFLIGYCTFAIEKE